MIIHENFPYFGASPDGLIECTCHGLGVVEIKCPFKFKKSKNIEKDLLDQGSCSPVIKSNNELVMNINHEYYFQIQLQLLLSKRNYGYFVVWSRESSIIVKVEISNDFLFEQIGLGKQFFRFVIMPELLGKYFSHDRISRDLLQPWQKTARLNLNKHKKLF